MKRLCIVLTMVIVAMTACACGRKDKLPSATTPAVTTPATIAPTDEMTLPTIDPTMGTNIPDPEVDPNSTMDMTDPTTNSETTPTDNESARGITRNRSGNRRGMNFGE